MKRQIHGATPPPNPFNLRTNNVSGEEIPASALLLVNDASDVDDNGNYDVTKPDGTDGAIWINSPAKTPSDKPGAATNRFPCMVACDGSPTPGEEWGPVADSWLLTSTGSGFRILGGAVDGLVRVEKIGSGGGSTPVDIKLGFIDHDIDGAVENDPPKELADSDILTPDEIDDDWEVVYQYPAPDEADDFTSNIVDTIDVYLHKRTKVTKIPYFGPGAAIEGTAVEGTLRAQAMFGEVDVAAQTITIAAVAGGAADGLIGNDANTVAVAYSQASNSSSYDPETTTLTINTTVASGVATTTDLQTSINAGSDFTASGASGSTALSATTGTISGLSGGQDTTVVLDEADGASDDDDFYNGDTFTITGGTGDGQSGTVSAYDGTSHTMTIDEDDWSVAVDNTSTYRDTSLNIYKQLVYETVDDTDAKKRYVRLALTEAYHDDGEPFVCGEYEQRDYGDDYDEDERGPWEEFKTTLPDGFLTKRYKALIINKIISRYYCWVLHPPTLPEADPPEAP